MMTTIKPTTHPPSTLGGSKQRAAERQRKLLSLFFAQYQTLDQRFPSPERLCPSSNCVGPPAPGDNTREDEDEPARRERRRREEKGKEKLTDLDQESGEEGLLAYDASASDHDDNSDDEEKETYDLGEEEDDAHPLVGHDEDEDEDDDGTGGGTDEHVPARRLPFDVSDLIFIIDDYEEEEEEEEEDKHGDPSAEAEAGLHEQSDRWERVAVPLKRAVRRPYDPKRQRRRWVKARDERLRVERTARTAEQFAAQKANATRGLHYRTIDYGSIRQHFIAPPAHASSTPPQRASSTHRIPGYEREVTSAIHRGAAVDCGLTAQQLNDLMSRDLTPEDYELLLRLDSTVKPKTLSSHAIDALPSRTVASGSPLLRTADERCAICMSGFEPGERVKELPRCRHVFHGDCITQWLSTSSTRCPLCGSPLD